MSFHYPRRVKDLPTLESDSDEDFNTPAKPKRDDNDAERRQNANKENEPNDHNSRIMGSSTKSFTPFTNMRMYPKRSAELPKLESDSEEEDNEKNDNLNCAILNDSFIMSPCKSELDESCSSATKSKQKKENESLSFVTHFNKMAIDSQNFDDGKCSPKSVPQIIVTDHGGTSRKPPGHPLEIIQENEVVENIAHKSQLRPPDPESQPKAKRDDLETPFKTTSSYAAETPFVTPQVRSFTLQRRPRELCTNQSQKSRNSVVNEFRSQKVLFQTPMAVERAPCIPNESLMSSLYDSINDSLGTPYTMEKSPQKQPPTEVKSKKSLEIEINEAEKRTTSENLESEKPKAVGPTTTKATVNAPSTSTTNSKESILNINNADYTIVRKLGSGGSSSVYLAQRRDSGKECALKVVDLRGDPAVVEGYLNETKLLAKLQGNVCVVSLYDYQLLQKESRLFMVMEKGDSDLNKILQGYTTSLPLYVLMNFLYQMLQAVNYIHQNGVIHSDLKPANFLMVKGRLKLIDFGIASNISLDSTSIIKFSQAGTFNYISPEALIDTSTGSSPMRNNQPKIKISTKSDVWSLGCILYLLLYKKTPFSHIKNVYAKISAITNPSHAIEYPDIPTYYPIMLAHMAKCCLQHNPKKRPSCAELLQYPFNMVIPTQHLTVPTAATDQTRN